MFLSGCHRRGVDKSVSGMTLALGLPFSTESVSLCASTYVAVVCAAHLYLIMKGPALFYCGVCRLSERDAFLW
jgi:hypothetical protein